MVCNPDYSFVIAYNVFKSKDRTQQLAVAKSFLFSSLAKECQAPDIQALSDGECGCHIRHNIKAWTTTDLFTEWLKNVNNNMRKIHTTGSTNIMLELLICEGPPILRDRFVVQKGRSLKTGSTVFGSGHGVAEDLAILRFELLENANFASLHHMSYFRTSVG